jgi:tetrapyrrole methylase family protein / MazG family protein
MKEFDDLKKTIDKLRSPEGCPWDNKQTHKSLLPYLYEESYEVGDSIIKGDKESLKEELGDLLLQIMLHSKITDENKEFDIKDVISLLNAKLIRRHPHVFGDGDAANADDVVKLWESIKKEEKKYKKHDSILDDVPNTFHPLLKSYKLQKKAAKVGFDWKDYKGVLDKIDEEIKELKEALSKDDNLEHIEHEIGDIMFALINLGKFLGIRPDAALSKANLRFMERFKYIEKRIKEAGKKFEDYDLKGLDELWNEAKKNMKPGD